MKTAITMLSMSAIACGAPIDEEFGQSGSDLVWGCTESGATPNYYYMTFDNLCYSDEWNGGSLNDPSFLCEAVMGDANVKIGSALLIPTLHNAYWYQCRLGTPNGWNSSGDMNGVLCYDDGWRGELVLDLPRGTGWWKCQ